MTTYRNPLTHGSGLFLDHKYPGENHMHGYSYLGPGTRLDIRLDENMKPRAGEEVKDALDATALRHDIAYQTIQDQYKKNKNKPKALAAVRKADDEFITQARHSSVQPLVKISAGLIKMKELGKSTGILSTTTFSGLGVTFHTKDGKEVSFTKKHDPTARLKKLANLSNPKPTKKMEGGLNPVLIPILASLAGTALGKVWDLVKEKIEGKTKGGGYAIAPELYKTDAQKRAFLRHVLN